MSASFSILKNLKILWEMLIYLRPIIGILVQRIFTGQGALRQAALVYTDAYSGKSRLQSRFGSIYTRSGKAQGVRL